MFYENKNIRLPDLHGWKSSNILLIILILLNLVRPELARWGVLFSGAILLVGLSGPLQANPGNTQSMDAKSIINLDYSSTTPITLSKMMVVGRANIRADISDVHRGLLEFDLNPEMTSAGSAATVLGDELPSDSTLTRESGNTLRHSSGQSGDVGLGTPRVTLAAVTQSGADKLASKNADAVPTRNEDDTLKGNILSIGGAALYPYATITLAVLALLGLVSVARRDDIA
jgi:hypothetical protein